jgi:Methyltransferase domain
MNRADIVKQMLAGRPSPVYLEIGVDSGATFEVVVADEKIAVDPAFRLSEQSRQLAEANARLTHYFEMTSDDFFTHPWALTLLEQRGLDVVFVDGNHTCGQVVRDVENSLRYLHDDGVIVIDDCKPRDPFLAIPALSYEQFCATYAKGCPPGAGWCRDVWKAVVYLRSTHDDLRITVLDCWTGIGLVSKGPAKSRLSLSAIQISALDYADLDANRNWLLNLKPA